MGDETATLYVVDDDDAARESLAFLLTAANFAVRSYSSAQSFLREAATAGPGCVITDVRMPDIDGIELLRRLRQRAIPLPVIVITGHGDLSLAIEAIRLGAVDFIEKPYDSDVILNAVSHALAAVPTNGAEDAEHADVRRRLAGLSARETQVLDGLLAGKPNKVIAADLGIDARNVEIHRANVMTKLDAKSLSNLVRMVLLTES